jgi:hypothetical protein
MPAAKGLLATARPQPGAGRVLDHSDPDQADGRGKQVVLVRVEPVGDHPTAGTRSRTRRRRQPGSAKVRSVWETWRRTRTTRAPPRPLPSRRCRGARRTRCHTSAHAGSLPPKLHPACARWAAKPQLRFHSSIAVCSRTGHVPTDFGWREGRFRCPALRRSAGTAASLRIAVWSPRGTGPGRGAGVATAKSGGRCR